MQRISVPRCWHASVKLATQSFTLATIPCTRTLRCAVAPQGQRSCRRFSPRTVKQCWRKRLTPLSSVRCSLLSRTPCTASKNQHSSFGQPAAMLLLLAMLFRARGCWHEPPTRYVSAARCPNPIPSHPLLYASLHCTPFFINRHRVGRTVARKGCNPCRCGQSVRHCALRSHPPVRHCGLQPAWLKAAC